MAARAFLIENGVEQVIVVHSSGGIDSICRLDSLVKNQSQDAENQDENNKGPSIGWKIVVVLD
jgi:hypothetical protein